jgi:integrase
MSVQHLRPSRRFPKGGWVVRYRDPNNATLRKTFERKVDAIAFEASVRVDKANGDFISTRKAATLFSVIAEEWYAIRAPVLKPKTALGYRQILDRHVLPALGLRAVGRITAGDVERLLASTGRQGGTQRNILNVVNPIMRHAVKNGLVRTNPCSQVEPPKVRRKKMEFLTPEEVLAVADAITPRYRTLVLMAAYTGMRAGELAALRVEHLDLLRGRVRVEESASDVGGELLFGPTKMDEPREVALPRFLVELLARECEGKGRRDLVFTGPNGAALRHGNYYVRHFKPAVRAVLPDKAGLRFHDLRHTAASILIQQGVHPKLISNRLGHKSINITMDLYGHLYDGHDDAIAATLDEVFTWRLSVDGSAAVGT